MKVVKRYLEKNVGNLKEMGKHLAGATYQEKRCGSLFSCCGRWYRGDFFPFAFSIKHLLSVLNVSVISGLHQH